MRPAPTGASIPPGWRWDVDGDSAARSSSTAAASADSIGSPRSSSAATPIVIAAAPAAGTSGFGSATRRMLATPGADSAAPDAPAAEAAGGYVLERVLQQVGDQLRQQLAIARQQGVVRRFERDVQSRGPHARRVQLH